jgi:hypothetical protein
MRTNTLIFLPNRQENPLNREYGFAAFGRR